MVCDMTKSSQKNFSLWDSKKFVQISQQPFLKNDPQMNNFNVSGFLNINLLQRAKKILPFSTTS